MSRLMSLCLAFFFSLTAAYAQTQIPSDSRLKSIASNKIVRIAYRPDATPFSFLNDWKEPAGYTIDLCRLVVKSLEQQLGLQDLKIEWVPVNVQTRFSAVASGKADMECGSSTVTLSRMKEVDFSSIVFVESTGVVVARSSNFRSFNDLAGKKIAVVSGTTNERGLNEQIRQRKLDATVIPVKEGEGMAALEAGKVDAYASDKLLLVGSQKKNPDALIMLPDDLSIEPYAIVLPRGDWAFRLAVNTGLAQVFRSGLNVEVFRRWFEQIGLRPGGLVGAAFMLGSLTD